MPIAGAVVIPVKREMRESLLRKLASLDGVTVEGMSDREIAIVVEAESMEGVENASRRITGWEEVMELQLVYLNWEEDPGSGDFHFEGAGSQ